MIPARLGPTQRAAVRIAMARAFGEGRPVTREQVIRDLYGTPTLDVPAPACNNDAQAHTVTPTLAVVFAAPPPVTPDVTPDWLDAHPDQDPDSAVSFVEAARMTGLTVGTVRRYAAPSSGKLRRLGTGVSLASVEALRAA